MEWVDDWGTKILTPDDPTATAQTLMPIEVHQHDDASDSKISRPISVAHRKLPADFTRERKTSLPPPPYSGGAWPSMPEDDDEEDVIYHRQSRLNSL
jgi:hypothetical protein